VNIRNALESYHQMTQARDYLTPLFSACLRNLGSLDLSFTNISNQCLASGIFDEMPFLSTLSLANTRVSTKGRPSRLSILLTRQQVQLAA